MGDKEEEGELRKDDGFSEVREEMEAKLGEDEEATDLKASIQHAAIS